MLSAFSTILQNLEREYFRHARWTFGAVVLLAVTILSGCSGPSEATVSADQSRKEVSEKGGVLSHLNLPLSKLLIPAGTNVSVRLLQSISSRSAQPGAEFDAELAQSIEVDTHVAFARGTRVRGRIVEAHPSGRLNDPGYLRLTLDSIQTADGKWLNIQTTSVSAKGRSHKKRNATLIGGGAGLGALIGGIAGGAKGAGIGAVSGAGAGTAGAYATGRIDVTLVAERKLTFATTSELTLKR